jgi:hypothetical protein
VADDEKVATLAQHLNSHGLIGIGEPVRPYAFIDLEQLHMVEERMVSSALELYVRDEMVMELFHRCFADGYAYRIAEELVEADRAGRAP